MGAQIAAHVANAGLPVLLLDLDDRTAREGLKRAKALKPDPFFDADVATRIATGSFDADLARIAEADWIVEAVVEHLDVKRALLERVDAVRRPGAIVSSNTSGIPLASLAEGRSDDFRRHWLGTHFFNPPRYLHLLEVIPTPETEPDVVRSVSEFADHRLGKGVVIAKDTPGFIANRLALFGVLRMLEVLERGEFSVEEIDAMTGPAIGRPKSATVRTMDIAGLDVLSLVVKDLHARLPAADRGALKARALLERMLAAGLLGEKSGGGFYRRVRVERRVGDPRARSSTLDIAPGAGRLGSLEQRSRSLTWGPPAVRCSLGRRVGRFCVHARADLGLLRRCRARGAHSLGDVDRVLQWELRLGAGADSDDRRHRRPGRGRWRAVAGSGATMPAVWPVTPSSNAISSRGSSRWRSRPAVASDLANRAASSRRMPAQASSIWETASWQSSSTRR